MMVAKFSALSPLVVLDERAENVIRVINYIIGKGDEEETPKPTETSHKDDGFWDF